MGVASHELKQHLVITVQEQGQRPAGEHRQKARDSYSVVIARAFLLFLLTFDLFLNAYLMMSLDRNNLLIGTLTIIISAIGQFSAITGQFGFQIGDTLLHLFVISDISLVLLSLYSDQFEQNFMTKLSFILSSFGFIVGCFILIKKRQAN